MIGYKKDGKKYVIGTVKWKDLKEYLPSKWKLIFSGPLDGILIILGMTGGGLTFISCKNLIISKIFQKIRTGINLLSN